MEAAFFNEYDVIVIITLLISSILAFIRGVIRELFSIFAWVGAALITFFYFRDIAAFLSDSIESKVLVSVVSVLGLFIVSIIILSIITSIIMDFSRDVRKGIIDRSLGFAFGLFRGFLIVAIMHYTLSIIYSTTGEPEWLKNAKTYNLTSFGADTIKSFTDGYFGKNDLDSELVKELYTSLSPTFIKYAPGSNSFSAITQKEIYRNILNSLPKYQRQRLAEQLGSLPPVPSEEELSEIVQESLNMYTNAKESGELNAEYLLTDKEMDVLKDTLVNITSANEETEEEEAEKPKEENLPWLKGGAVNIF